MIIKENLQGLTCPKHIKQKNKTKTQNKKRRERERRGRHPGERERLQGA